MIILLSNGEQLRGDLIHSAVIRSDCAPVPKTLELDVKAGDDDIDSFLAEGQTLTDAEGDEFYIVKSVRVAGRCAQGEHEEAAFRLTALLNSCLSIAEVRQRAVIKENVSLSAIYRAAGASIKAVDADLTVPRFSCFVGDTPSFHIARILQEEGGIVRWKSGKLQFLRLRDIFAQEAVMTLPNTSAKDVDSDFLERRAVPWFYSLDDSGGFIYGNREKARSVKYSPFKNALRLNQMSSCLIRRKVAKITYDINICAGDLVKFSGQESYAVITAAHCYISGTDNGGNAETFTRLWLGEIG